MWANAAEELVVRYGATAGIADNVDAGVEGLTWDIDLAPTKEWVSDVTGVK